MSAEPCKHHLQRDAHDFLAACEGVVADHQDLRLYDWHQPGFLTERRELG
jgi:hypothetical protein